jgi:hypothetical protein
MAKEEKPEAKVAKEAKPKRKTAKEDFPRKRLGYLQATYGESKGQAAFDEEQKAGKILYPK